MTPAPPDGGCSAGQFLFTFWSHVTVVKHVGRGLPFTYRLSFITSYIVIVIVIVDVDGYSGRCGTHDLAIRPFPLSGLYLFVTHLF